MSALPQSWVASANTGVTDFPLQNLPYGVFSTASQPTPRVGVAIGDQVLDLAALEAAGVLKVAEAGGATVFSQPAINAFVALGSAAWRATRARLTSLLAVDGDAALRENAALRAQALVPLAQVTLHLPVQVPGYTDFYSSREHATNVGSMFRDPANALLPNWLEIPIGYNGRASSVVVSGTPIHRPNGQIKLPDAPRPIFDACRKLDFELETGFIVGRDTSLGDSLSVDAAEAAIFGMVLLNDWSARDLQQWEYVPLGPFNSKSFGTSISPWVVTMEALEPFRVAGPEQNPQPVSYLQQQGKHAFDIALEVLMQADGDAQATSICRTNFRHMYWSMAQQFAHHTVSGCNVRVGDLMGSGTISGPTPDSFGSLLELTWNGKNPITLASGAKRTFIEDGDTVMIAGWCQGNGYRVGFGEVSGQILPAKAR
ncbi:fumarylacetoacetase [Pandoraea sp. XJJ-1]|uniref:fumarylacetoacetase n=1 Tax=unclassified Pandoraea TaxID=2624094 RepID=UPI000969D689|nr:MULTISPECIES: fumarylacetoacetase [unclassified Pandoraea]OJY20920.1 MAG: fumarylacetoacetase [Pandoraea sp. 64-18]WAL80762.1 fumarylacetoacetase [Pandoraea sp. XJJ-1]